MHPPASEEQIGKNPVNDYKKSTRKAGRPKSNGRLRHGSDDVSLSALLEAKKLVAVVGSIEEAKKALNALSRLI